MLCYQYCCLSHMLLQLIIIVIKQNVTPTWICITKIYESAQSKYIHGAILAILIFMAVKIVREILSLGHHEENMSLIWINQLFILGGKAVLRGIQSLYSNLIYTVNLGSNCEWFIVHFGVGQTLVLNPRIKNMTILDTIQLQVTGESGKHSCQF